MALETGRYFNEDAASMSKTVRLEQAEDAINKLQRRCAALEEQVIRLVGQVTRMGRTLTAVQYSQQVQVLPEDLYRDIHPPAPSPEGAAFRRVVGSAAGAPLDFSFCGYHYSKWTNEEKDMFIGWFLRTQPPNTPPFYFATKPNERKI